jgi:hypothetical protein
MASFSSILALGFVLLTVYAGAVKKSGLRAALFKSDNPAPPIPSNAGGAVDCARCKLLEEEVSSLKLALAVLRAPRRSSANTANTASGRWSLRRSERSESAGSGCEGMAAGGSHTPRSPIGVQVVIDNKLE